MTWSRPVELGSIRTDLGPRSYDSYLAPLWCRYRAPALAAGRAAVADTYRQIPVRLWAGPSEIGDLTAPTNSGTYRSAFATWKMGRSRVNAKATPATGVAKAARVRVICAYDVVMLNTGTPTAASAAGHLAIQVLIDAPS